jgi:peptide/nickel transport system substrate-binding protein
MLQPFVANAGFCGGPGLVPQTSGGTELMRRYLRICFAMIATVAAALSPAAAQDKPRYGGELLFAVPSEPPSYDAHREETFGVIHPMAPHYNTLLRVDPNDKTGTKPVGDLAESWTAAKDGRTYTFKLRRGVKFHDGSEMTSKDVKASYDKIIFPPAGVASDRQGQYLAVEAVQAPDPYTVVFRLKWPSASFLASVASPWNWIYKADILAKDMRWYETHVMGTGPFLFVEHQKGSHWVGKKNPNYWDKGKPYLDGYRAIFIKDSAAQVAAVRAERAHIQFRGFSPAERDSLVAALGPKITVQESPWDCALLVAINHEKKPFDDKRVRRALTLALDRYLGSQALSKIAIVKEVAGVQVPGTPYATSPAELEKLAGYGRDIVKARAEAKQLLRDAGVPDGFSFTFKNRGIPMPYEPVGVWLIDQWRQVGLNVKQEVVEAAAYYGQVLRPGNFELAMDFQCGYIVEPDLDLYKFQSKEISPANYSRYTDKALDELFIKQGRTGDVEERKRYIREFEKRLLDDEVHYLYTLQWNRIIPHNSKVRNWTITPSHYLNDQLDAVWLAE